MMIMNLVQFWGSVEMGLICAFVGFGVYLSFRTLQFPDMTVDGSFPLGAAVTASLIVNGVHPAIATIIAIFAGSCAGLITAFLSTRLKMLNLLAGIVTMTGLYSINLRVMGSKPNISLLGEETLFTAFQDQYQRLIILTFLTAIVLGKIYFFLKTEIGLGVRATGINPRMTRAQGIDDHKMIYLGLAISNACVALAGALFAQINGYADVTMGLGTIIMGLVAVIVGEAIFHTRTVFIALFSCIVGAILYRLVIAIALNGGEFGIMTSDTQLVTAVLVTLAMLLPKFRQKILSKKKVGS